MTESANLEPVFRGALKLIEENAPLDEVAGAIESPGEPPQEERPFPDLPSPLPLSAEVKAAMLLLPDLFGKVHPVTRRALDENEVKAIGREAELVKAVKAVLEDRDKAIGEIVRVHNDVTAETQGVAVSRPHTGRRGGEIKVIVEATQRDSKGHYLLSAPQNPVQVPIPGTGKAFSQEFTSGKISYNEDALQALVDSNALRAAEYRAITTRRLDPAKMSEFIRKHPARGLEVLRRITRRSAPGQSMYIRKSK